MKLARIGLPLALLLLAACGKTTHVDQPVAVVHDKLAALPPQANALTYTTKFPGTDYFVEPQGDRLVWHFRHEGKDYGRFVAKLKEDGPNSTNVSTWFEKSNDAQLSNQLGFLRDLAKAAAEASVDAALTGKTVDQGQFKQFLVAQATANPMGAAQAAMGTASAAVDKAMKEQADRDYYNSPVVPKGGVLPEPGVLPERGGVREQRMRQQRYSGQ
jgi:hypothetical protein